MPLFMDAYRVVEKLILLLDWYGPSVFRFTDLERGSCFFGASFLYFGSILSVFLALSLMYEELSRSLRLSMFIGISLNSMLKIESLSLWFYFSISFNGLSHTFIGVLIL